MTELELLAALPPPDAPMKTVVLEGQADADLAFQCGAMGYMEGDYHSPRNSTAPARRLKAHLTQRGVARLTALEAAEGTP